MLFNLQLLLCILHNPWQVWRVLSRVWSVVLYHFTEFFLKCLCFFRCTCTIKMDCNFSGATFLLFYFNNMVFYFKYMYCFFSFIFRNHVGWLRFWDLSRCEEETQQHRLNQSTSTWMDLCFDTHHREELT